MKKIEGTELEFEDHDEVVLDYYLNGEGETKEEWATRVWDCCKRCFEGEDEARVYKCRPGQTWQERAKELWENSKSVRKDHLAKFHKIKDDRQSLLDFKEDQRFKDRVNAGRIKT